MDLPKGDNDSAHHDRMMLELVRQQILILFKGLSVRIRLALFKLIIRLD